ncbi:MAG: HD domain-containing phosphohydrolase [Leptospirales bacterium]
MTRQPQIPIEGRIVAIADVFDALTSKRPYKEAWPVEKSVDYIRSESGKHFDPELVNVFLEKLLEVISIKKQYKED